MRLREPNAPVPRNNFADRGQSRQTPISSTVLTPLVAKAPPMRFDHLRCARSIHANFS